MPKYSESDWIEIVKERYGFDPKHLVLSHSSWMMCLWDENQVPELAKNDSNLQSRLDKLFAEIKQNARKTVLPLSIKVKSNIIPYVLSYEKPKEPLSVQKAKNILTLPGMGEMAKRSAGVSSSTNTYHAIGIGTISETDADDALEHQVAIKQIGSRGVVNQTERYATSFNDSDVPSLPVNATEAGIYTATPGGILIARVTASPTIINTGKIATFSTNITHQNGATS